MWQHIDIWRRLVSGSELKLNWWWLLRLEVLLWRWIGIPWNLVSLIWLPRKRILILRSSSVPITKPWMRPLVIGVVNPAITLLWDIHCVDLYRALLLVDMYLHVETGVLLVSKHSTCSTAFYRWLSWFLLYSRFELLELSLQLVIFVSYIILGL